MSTRNSQRGSAMLVTMILIAALLAGAAVLVTMQIAGNRSTEMARTGMTALHCAESGLASARATVKQNYASWASALAASAGGDTSEPSWLASGIGSHDLDGDGTADFLVYLKDNDDEGPPTANNLALDNDLRIFIVSKCLAFPDTPKQVMELVQYRGGGGCPHNGAGGCDGNGNAN
jgi:hypothetical protein